MTDGQIYEIVTPVMNECDGRFRKPDAVRHWVGQNVNELLALVNGDPPRHTFDEQTLALLVENFFSPFLEKK